MINKKIHKQAEEEILKEKLKDILTDKINKKFRLLTEEEFMKTFCPELVETPNEN